ncbi:c-type cytochrome [Nitrospirillum iridis]|uniref:Mono/diheme cytochrome c family protein n=1 Tax=Nitrospirillum iridis TaxID=765888 RepID=A0A7X0AV99_9PROT|nr:cytochrome c [Nitrospirillum iridis]MBB6250728.1 mono/diheme cytochrome c family protein [Nitrospirillum iridis]
MKKPIRIAALLTATAALALPVPGPARGDEAPPAASTKHANLLGYTQFPQRDGESLYKSVCAACHMPDARGGTGAGYYPPLAKDANLAAWGYPATLVMNGSKGMPAFRTMMDDAQIAAVVTYVRTHFGNAYTDKVSVDEVAALRKAQ